jgi:hypothetical protein
VDWIMSGWACQNLFYLTTHVGIGNLYRKKHVGIGKVISTLN